MRRSPFLLLLLCLGLSACAGGERNLPAHAEDGGTDAPDSAGDGGAEMAPTALLELVALDVWGQPLPAATTELGLHGAQGPLTRYGWPSSFTLLSDAQPIRVTLQAPDFEPLSLSLDYDGSADLGALTITDRSGAIGHGVSVSHDLRLIDGVWIPVHTIYLGLRHQWFSAQGRPARSGNQIELFLNGAEAWSSVAEDLRAGQESAHFTTWWWNSDFELIRPEGTHPYLSAAERQANSLLAHLDRFPGTVRVIAPQFGAQDSPGGRYLAYDEPLEDRGRRADDGVEFMAQANETESKFEFEVAPFKFKDRLSRFDPQVIERPLDREDWIRSTVPPRSIDLTQWPVSADVPIASYHQKLVVVDDRIAYVSGMNYRYVDWDTASHEVFNPRRMHPGASAQDRLDVLAKKKHPDEPPRRDFMTRIVGPLVRDVQAVFHARWAQLLRARVRFSANASPFALAPDPAPQPGGLTAQITTTMPLPHWEHSIAESWFNAVGQAERFIFIEDQYFRMPMMLELLQERMREVPALRLIVFTTRAGSLGCWWTNTMYTALKDEFPERFEVYQYRSFDFTRDRIGQDETRAHFVDMSVHSKLLIVDDRFLSVGSCNKNNRGLVYEAEMNLAVLDDTWVKEQRRRLLAGVLPPGTEPSDELEIWAADIRRAAVRNQAVYDAWEGNNGHLDLNGAPLPSWYMPQGHIYPKRFGTPKDCAIENVGPDQT